MYTNTEAAVWAKTIELLQAFSVPSPQDVYVPRPSAMPRPPVRANGRQSEHCTGKITILERSSPDRATIAWLDPTVCHYGNQTWVSGVARYAGVCAVSGRMIRRGDAIFRPRVSRPAPLNAHAMIMACCIESIQPDTLFIDATSAATA